MSVSIGASGLLTISNSAWDNPNGTPATQESTNISYTNGNVGIGVLNANSDLQIEGSVSETVTIVTGNFTLNENHNNILFIHGNLNLTVTLPNALTCLGRKYRFSRYAASAGNITLTPPVGNLIQNYNGTTAASTVIGTFSNPGGGLYHSFTAVNVNGVGVWARI